VPTGEPVTLAFGGDVHFEGEIAGHLEADPASVFGPISETLSAADLAVVNLETAITTGGEPEPKKYTFRAPATALDAITAAGVDVVSLANNHGLDFGEDAFLNTLEAAEEADLPVVGAGLDEEEAYAPYRQTVNGQRIAIFGATQVLDAFAVESWTAGPDEPGLASAEANGIDRLLDSVRAARQDSDTVVVMLHWGQSYTSCPIPRQQDLARELIDAGADVLVGGHAHILLGGGYLDGAYVDYGLGNFVFYARPGDAAQSGVLTLTVAGRAITDAQWHPAVIQQGRPLPVEGEAAEEVLETKEERRIECTDLAAEPTSDTEGDNG
jgi:poly-gamma-glutamate synthesis protein (capsule biosynthesis protein)